MSLLNTPLLETLGRQLRALGPWCRLWCPTTILRLWCRLTHAWPQKTLQREQPVCLQLSSFFLRASVSSVLINSLWCDGTSDLVSAVARANKVREH